jgi:PAS domain S-box-containing protein
MQPWHTRYLPRSAMSAAWLAISIALAISVLDLVGWASGVTLLKSIGSHWIPMKVITALCMALCAVQLALLQKSPLRGRNFLVLYAPAILVCLVGLLTIAVYAIELSTGQEASLAKAAFLDLFLDPPGRMALLTGILFVLIGSALSLLASGGARAADIAHVLVLPAAMASYLVPISYLLGVVSIHEWLHVPVALNTGIAFCALCIAVLCVRPDTWLMSVFVGDHAGGRMARRLLPGLVLLPMVIGWLRLHGERVGVFESEVGVVLVAVTYTVCFLLLVWGSARSVSQTDEKRRAAEHALRESEERRKVAEVVQAERQRFNNVLETLPAYVVLLTPDYHVPFANRVFRERFGESHGKRCFEYLFHRTEPCEICETYTVLKTNAEHHWEWTGPDGRNYDVYDFPFTDTDGSPLIMEMGIDITERKRAEAAVQAERRRFLDMLDTLPVVIDIIRADHRIEWANRAYREALGDNQGRLCFESQFGRDTPCEECQAFVPLKTGRPHNWEWTLPNGRTFDIHNFPFVDAAGSPAILEMDVDITVRKQAEAALKQINETLEQRVSQRTEELTQLTTQLRAEIDERRKAEEALRRAKEEWERTFDSMPDLVAILDDQHRVVRANKAMAQRLGAEPDECIGLHCYEAVHGLACPPDICPHRRTLADGLEHTAELHEDRLGGDFLVSTTPLHDPQGRMTGAVHIAHDITEQKRAQREREITIEFLHLVNTSVTTRDLIQAAASFFQEQSGCEAVGIRLKEGDDYPYYEARGFPREFLLVENSLCARDAAGEFIRDNTGDPLIECMCGNVICGRFDPSKPFFTARGGFWTNCTTELLATTTEADRQARTRNRCNGEGYESVALLPLHLGEQRLGLLQLNDKRKGVFSIELIRLWERLADHLAVSLAKCRAEEALRLTQASIDVAAEMVAWFTPDGRVRYVNDATCRTLGYSREELLNMTAMDFSPSFALEPYAEHWREVRERKSFTLEVRHRRKDGSEYPAEVLVNHVVYGGQEYIFAYGRDITERKQAEAALEQARVMQAEAQKIAHLGSFEYIAATGKTLWSDEEFRIYGLEPGPCSPSYADLMQKHFHPDDAARVDRKFAETLRSGSFYEIEHRIVRPDGTVRDLYNVAQPYFDAAGKLVRYVGATLDITERKEAEKALRASEHFYRQTLESIPGMVFTTRPDGYCDYQSQQWVDFTGVPMSEHVGDGWNKLLHPDDRPRAFAAWRDAVEGRAPYDLEYRVRRHDGQYEWFKVRGAPIHDAAGQIVRWFGVAANIDALKRAEEEIRLHLEKLKAANEELARFNRVAVDRELRMIELKKQINDFCARAGEPERYRVEGQ